MMKMARMMPMMVIMMPMPMTMAILWTNLSANRVSQPGLFIVNVATKEVRARTLPDRSFLIISCVPSSPMYYHIKAYLYHPHKRSASQNSPCRSFLDCHCHDCNDNFLILMLFGPGVYLITQGCQIPLEKFDLQYHSISFGLDFIRFWSLGFTISQSTLMVLFACNNHQPGIQR